MYCTIMFCVHQYSPGAVVVLFRKVLSIRNAWTCLIMLIQDRI